MSHTLSRAAASLRRPVPAVLLAAAGLLLSGLSGCRTPAPDPERPDLILIVVDTLRADHLGAYGYERPTSPRLDALAANGAVFDAAWAAAPWTLPSVMSIMTSSYPSAHRVENDGLRLAQGVPTLAGLLRERGYATGGFAAHVYVTAAFGFDRGFERYEDFGLSQPGYRLETGMEPTADRVTDAALAWLREQDGRPVFLFVHYFDPHWPYNPPERFRALFPSGYKGELDAGYDAISRFIDPLVPLPEDYRGFLIDRYDGEIRFVDEQIGRLLDGLAKLRRAGRSFVVVTGDHGEEFKEHGSMGHGRQMYEEVVRVPLIVAGPPGAATPAGGDAGGSGRKGRRVDTPVSGIDVAPTLLDLAGVHPPSGVFRGASLRSFVPGEAAAEPAPAAGRPLLSETARLNAFRKAVRSGGWKLIQFMDENRAELYDLPADPGERRDRAGELPEERRRLRQALFAESDLLSGGWNLRWAGDGRPHRFAGRVTTSGVFRTVVPLFEERGRYVIKQGKILEFNDDGQTGESGFAFTTSPSTAPVIFHLTVDGRAEPGRVVLGAKAARAPTMPFELEGEPSDEAAFHRPAGRPGEGGGYMVWRTRPAAPDQPLVLDEETRERLKSLGYVN